MANYALRATTGRGITKGHGSSIQSEVWKLVAYAAANVPFNRLAVAPKGWSAVEEKSGKTTRIIHKHEKTNIVFQPGFHMYRTDGGDQKWEGRTPTKKDWAYRLDLQGITENGANFSLQTNGKDSVSVAVCMMELNKSFGKGQLVKALSQSAATGDICDLTA